MLEAGAVATIILAAVVNVVIIILNVMTPRYSRDTYSVDEKIMVSVVIIIFAVVVLIYDKYYKESNSDAYFE